MKSSNQSWRKLYRRKPIGEMAKGEYGINNEDKSRRKARLWKKKTSNRANKCGGLSLKRQKAQ